jgi:hypothetical protein
MDNPLRRWAPESLSSETAFVVHLGPGAAGSFTALQGRVEHVRSGQSRRFVSTEELVTFMCQALAGQS